MGDETAAMEVITTHTEAEALLLEANLIQRLSRASTSCCGTRAVPPAVGTEAIRLGRSSSYRGAQVRKGSYWGPFASAWAVTRR